MLDLFLCHSPAESQLAAILAARLERTAEAHVWMEQLAAGQSVTDVWDRGLGCAAVLLLLSPAAVPARSGRGSWAPLLDHQQRNDEPPVATVLAENCAYPPLLERSHFFRWAPHATAAARALQQWVVGLHGPAETSFHPARLPNFDGCERELEVLFDRLVDRAGDMCLVAGPPESGKTALAHEFARRAGAFFRDVFWLSCGDRTLPWLSGELGMSAGVLAESESQDAWTRTARAITSHRILLVLDEAGEQIVQPYLSGGHASILVTGHAMDTADSIRLERRRPTAIQAPSHPDDLRLWRAMSVCSPREIPLEFAAEAAGLDRSEAAQAAGRLVAARLADPVDERSRSFRVSRSSRRAAHADLQTSALFRRHAEVLRAALSNQTIPQLPAALRWALAEEWELGVALAKRSFAFLHRERRMLESIAVMDQLRRAAERRGDEALAAECRWELSWFQDTAGALRPAPSVGEQLSLF